MKFSLNVKDRDEKLGAFLGNKQQYDCKIWAVIMKNTANLMGKSIYFGSDFAGLTGDLAGMYCYIGIMNSRLFFSIVDSFNVEKNSYNLIVPFDDLKQVKVKGGIIPGRKVILLYFVEDGIMKISVMNNAIGSDINDQKENATRFLQLISTIN